MANAKPTKRRKPSSEGLDVVKQGSKAAHEIDTPTSVSKRVEVQHVTLAATTPLPRQNLTLLPVDLHSSPPLPSPMSSARLFIASLGNPGPLAKTRHSAGHVLLRALQSHLGFPALRRSKPHAGGLLSSGADVGRPEYTLWHSPSLMNVSGPGLLKAYREFAGATAAAAASSPDRKKPSGGDDAPLSAASLLPGLVILLDEMETPPGQLRVRLGPTSARGHNGVKSVQQSLQGAGLMDRLDAGATGAARFIKIGVGIGRPPGGTRERGDVSDYVLAPFSERELQELEGSVGRLVELLERERARIDG